MQISNLNLDDNYFDEPKKKEINYSNMKNSLDKSINRLNCISLNSFLIHSKVYPDQKLFDSLDYFVEKKLFRKSGWAGQFAFDLPENFWKGSLKIMQTYHQQNDLFFDKLKKFFRFR